MFRNSPYASSKLIATIAFAKDVAPFLQVPFYRENLRFSVIPRPHNAYEALMSYIQCALTTRADSELKTRSSSPRSPPRSAPAMRS